jgi:hypothetical protein
MSNYISKIEQSGVEYAIHDELLASSEVLVNGKAMPSFVEALAAAQGASHFELLKNIILTGPVNIPVGSEVILDLNGHTISPDKDCKCPGAIINVLHGSSLTVNGEGSIIGAVPGTTNVYAAIQVTHKDFIDDTKPAILTINGGHIIGYYYSIVGNGNPGRGNTHITINGGTLEGIVHSSSIIYNPQENSTVVINGGTIIGASTGVEMRSGNLIVNGGRIEALGAPASVAANGSGTTASGSAIAICQHTTKNPIDVKINGGIMLGYHALYQANPQKNDEAAIEKIHMSVTNGVFVARNSNMPVYSENKTGFVKGGTFSAPLDPKYLA